LPRKIPRDDLELTEAWHSAQQARLFLVL
jgi:hypothetical protein